ncbi:hypothetical protein [Microbacterium sp. NPDC076895]|uniref:hypothetical protein n=1 Tax=Microbacterium sp. NPDC076895 TaxID=3154957 RepID=UPI003443ABA0
MTTNYEPPKGVKARRNSPSRKFRLVPVWLPQPDVRKLGEAFLMLATHQAEMEAQRVTESQLDDAEEATDEPS